MYETHRRGVPTEAGRASYPARPAPCRTGPPAGAATSTKLQPLQKLHAAGQVRFETLGLLFRGGLEEANARASPSIFPLSSKRRRPPRRRTPLQLRLAEPDAELVEGEGEVERAGGRSGAAEPEDVP